MNNFFVIVACLAIIVGVLIFLRLLRSKKYEGDPELLEYKDDLPILPRDQRQMATVDVSVQNAEQNQATETNQVVSEFKQHTQHLASDISKTQDDAPKNAFAKNPAQPITKGVKHSDEFTQNSPIIDEYLNQAQTFDQNNDPLLKARDGVTIVITPRNQVGLSGRDVLNIVRSYELRYGVKNLYHRYEHQDGKGNLWFSMLGVTYDGMHGFDLNTLADSHFVGLALFLSLPNPHALRGFNSMVSTARMIAKDLDADIHDENGYLFDDDYLNKMYLKVKNFPAT